MYVLCYTCTYHTKILLFSFVLPPMTNSNTVTWSSPLQIPDDYRLYNSHHQENQHSCNCNSCHCQSRLYSYKCRALHLSHSHYQIRHWCTSVVKTLTCRQARWLKLTQTRVTGWPRLMCTMSWKQTEQTVNVHVVSLVLELHIVATIHYASPLGHMKIHLILTTFCCDKRSALHLIERFEIWHLKILYLYFTTIFVTWLYRNLIEM